MTGLHRSTPAELKERLEAERRGAPFLLYFDGAGHQVLHELAGPLTVGRGADCDVALGWDREVSRLHAQLERVGAHWVLVDDGLSRNGSFVNGERVVGRRTLREGDRLVFGDTPVVYRAPADAGASSTINVGTSPAAVNLTPTQKQAVVLRTIASFRTWRHGIGRKGSRAVTAVTPWACAASRCASGALGRRCPP